MHHKTYFGESNINNGENASESDWVKVKSPFYYHPVTLVILLIYPLRHSVFICKMRALDLSDWIIMSIKWGHIIEAQ